ncbi:MAG: rod shape-determining protein [Candidatus Doudnabacteria bacterium]|nr:rod shape-determining protein [Candidatus Doudnabacteria bacterium]
MKLSEVLNNITQLFGQDIAIDLGTATTQVAVKGHGVVMEEPSVVAINNRNGQIMAVGAEAKHMAGRTPGNITVVRPLQGGVISDFDATEAMLKYFLDQIYAKFGSLWQFNRPVLVVGVPSVITEVESRAVIDAGKSAGARKVYLVEEPIAAAIGSGVDISEAHSTLVVDIGGGTSDVALISMGGMVVDSTIKVAGDEMNAALVAYIRHKYNLLISENIAEEIKINWGSASKLSKELEGQVAGRDLLTGLPKSVKLSGVEIREALLRVVDQVVDAVHATVEKSPPEVLQDLMTKGVFLVGGGAQLRGLDKYISGKLHLPVKVIATPQRAVVMGLLSLLDQVPLLEKVQVREQRFL